MTKISLECCLNEYNAPERLTAEIADLQDLQDNIRIAREFMFKNKNVTCVLLRNEWLAFDFDNDQQSEFDYCFERIAVYDKALYMVLISDCEGLPDIEYSFDLEAK